MQISVLIGILAALVSAPYWTARLYAETESWERTQIIVDNAAILVGRADRELFRYVQAGNRLLRALEAVHDPLHVCARTPVGETCIAQDAALERQIALLHRTIRASAEGLWRAAGLVGLAYLSENGVRVRTWRRSPSAPLVEKRCRICRMAWAWEISPEAAARETWVRADHAVPIGVGVRAEGESLVGGETWNYRLMPWSGD